LERNLQQTAHFIDIFRCRTLKPTEQGLTIFGQRIGIGSAYDDPKIAVLTQHISGFHRPRG
jgi:hypothetical protein